MALGFSVGSGVESDAVAFESESKLVRLVSVGRAGRLDKVVDAAATRLRMESIRSLIFSARSARSSTDSDSETQLGLGKKWSSRGRVRMACLNPVLRIAVQLEGYQRDRYPTPD